MVGPIGTVSELFAKMLLFHKTILCEWSEDRKIQVLYGHNYIFTCVWLQRVITVVLETAGNDSQCWTT